MEKMKKMNERLSRNPITTWTGVLLMLLSVTAVFIPFFIESTYVIPTTYTVGLFAVGFGLLFLKDKLLNSVGTFYDKFTSK
jgi:hypothetical protein